MDTVIIIILCAAVAILVLAVAAAYAVFRIFFTNPGEETARKNPEPLRLEADRLIKTEQDWFMSCHPVRYCMIRDGLKLYGWYMDKGSANTVILVHGWHDTGYTRTGQARFYAETLGYNVFLPNLRCHGESEGRYIGMAGRDRKDLIGWIELLEKHHGEKRIVLDGQSMGGATVLALSGDRELPASVKVVISDSGFSSVRDMAAGLFKGTPRIFTGILMELVTLWCFLLLGETYRKEAPIEQAALSGIPILIIHGTADTFVPFSMADKIYGVIKAPRDRLYVEGASHVMSYWKDRKRYEAKVTEFLAEYMQK